MASEHDLVGHYDPGVLLESIAAGLAELGKSPADATVEDLGPVDEFHVGGRAATVALLAKLDISDTDHVLDVGCGIGGTARLLASTAGCRVTGLDLVPNFVEVARELSQWTGLAHRIDYRQGSALAMPFEDESFDAATQLHVGMNIADKAALFAEVRRVLKPGAKLGVYDILRAGDGDITFPVPWASEPSMSALESTDQYVDALERSGFEVQVVDDRRQFAVDFFTALRAKAAAQASPPPIGLQLIIGRNAPEKLANMIAAINAGSIAPTELVCVAAT